MRKSFYINSVSDFMRFSKDEGKKKIKKENQNKAFAFPFFGKDHTYI